MSDRYEQTARLAAEYGQEHLLRFYDSLSDDAKTRLLDQIERLDFPAIAALASEAAGSLAASGALAPIEALDMESMTPEQRELLTEKGWSLLREGKVAALVVAGGQGSRLGHDGPKGTFDIGLPSGKSLFQLQAERLLGLSAQAGRTVPWYVMTSPENNAETVRFFDSHGCFGYKPEDVYMLEQQALPSLDASGRILLSAPGEIGLAPSGNGDAFASLKRSGALADMLRRGVEWVFYYNVDNALIRIADPLFVGAAAFYNNPIATKAADKTFPEEKVGILVQKDGRPAVVEYTDVPKELLYETDGGGQYVYRLGNLSIHLFRLDFIQQYADAGVPYHAAHKKIATVDEKGERLVPEAPNAYKFETFIFDFFPLAERMTVLKIRREEEFAPVKNKDGDDSPHTARRLLFDLHRKWLEQAGFKPPEGRDIEISPLVSYAGEGLTPEIVRSFAEQTDRKR
ncbi:UTP--glucose-1-phosphate uridylyltransferase [Paenibacillus ginsengarvi]|uniref:UDPGP type 1 family protein n=1 Tax=Paenibacillus ginsengarvi TaxID=400777 RepID=A0A3B0C3X2_9BACL|nr:UDPGP type 1 family protein [Paenibacillus ginsengarvi]RKN79221.1 UDPGP type 1 family protein [Paenibacillus ginsengarvi]